MRERVEIGSKCREKDFLLYHSMHIRMERERKIKSKINRSSTLCLAAHGFYYKVAFSTLCIQLGYECMLFFMLVAIKIPMNLSIG